MASLNITRNQKTFIFIMVQMKVNPFILRQAQDERIDLTAVTLEHGNDQMIGLPEKTKGRQNCRPFVFRYFAEIRPE